MTRIRPLLVFAAAVAVRSLYIWQIRDAPYFDVPLVDGANYFQTASAIAAGDLLGGGQVFWQPPLYPYFLALLLGLFGPRMGLIYLVQAVLGAISCVLVYFIGRRLFGEREAICAALVMVLYGPLIYFDAQPLIPCLHIVLMLAGLLLILISAGIEAGPVSPAARGGGAGVDADDRAHHALGSALGLWSAAGLLWGLSAIATPNILVAVPLVVLWMLWRFRASGAAVGAMAPTGGTRSGSKLRSGVPAATVFLLGVMIPVLSVTVRNLAVAGEFVLVSSNGGINFYIGNNADYERTIRIRPGGEFERLVQEPENLGIASASGRSRYFARRAWAFISSYPYQWLKLCVRKAFDLIAGREIPRNQEVYAQRAHSGLLSILLWRFGIAFPFGVVAPLALAGVAIGRGGTSYSGRSLLLMVAVVYAASVVLFFPTGRYRLPLVPIAALFAGRFLGSIGRRSWRPRVMVALAAGLLLFNADALEPTESYPEERALNLAYALRVKGRLGEAKEEYRRAIDINPRRIDPHNSLAVMAAQEGRWEEAASHYRDLLEIAPDFIEVRRNLGRALQAMGQEEEARRQWEIAIHLAPNAAPALVDLCMSYLDEGRPGIAEGYCARAVRARPDLGEPHLALGMVARAQRQRDRAMEEFEAAARIFPDGSRGARRAAELLDEMRDAPGHRRRTLEPQGND